MDKSVIKRHNFEIEKKKIQTFSNNLPSIRHLANMK